MPMTNTDRSTTPERLLDDLRHYAPEDEQQARDERREFTIDELAREAGATVRNVRAYQDRGLLPPPEKRGRTGIYTDVHLARLKIIGQLLERGYTLRNIHDLVAAWEEGRNLDDILGLEVAATSWKSGEIPDYVDYQDLLRDFGEEVTPDAMTKAVKLGYIIPEGMRLRVPYPRIYNAGKELVEAGIPLDALLTHVSLIRKDVDKLADRFIGMIVQYLVDEKYGENGLPEGEDVPWLADFITRVRPLADMVVSTELSRVLDRAISKVLVDRLENVLEHFQERDGEK
jgi:DNA-binding transcriptional MerR regulator